MDRIKEEYKINKIHQMGITGKNINVAIIDTGINNMVSELKNTCMYQLDVVNNKKNPYDDNGHGTHVAGIIAANTKGIAPDSKIISIKALDRLGKGSFDDFISGINFIIKNQSRLKIRIVNMSVGASINKNTSKELDNAIEKMWESGIVVIAAAGNNGPNTGSVSIPGNNRKIITVGAYDDDMEVRLSRNQILKNYSGRGPTNECVIKPEILASGYHISSISHTGGYVSRSGTSMATPIVSGLVALLLSVYPNLTPKEVKKLIYSTAIPVNNTSNKASWGKIGLQNYILRE